MRVRNHKIEDRILLKKAARDRCRQSLAIIYLKYQPMICDFLRKSGADGMAEDICQSVFMQLHEGKCKYDGSSEAKTYLFGVASNIHKNDLKADNVKTYGLSPVEINGDLLVQESVLESPYDILENAESRQFIRGIIAQLPPKSRQVIELIYLEGKTRQEAADHLDSDYFSVCKSIKYGKNKLKEKISKIAKSLLLKGL